MTTTTDLQSAYDAALIRAESAERKTSELSTALLEAEAAMTDAIALLDRTGAGIGWYPMRYALDRIQDAMARVQS